MAGSGKRKQGARVGKRDRKAGVRAGKRDRKPGARVGKRDRMAGARTGLGDRRLRPHRVRLEKPAPLPMPGEAESDSAVAIDVVTEEWESYEDQLRNDWSKITKPLPNLQRVVQEVQELKRAAEMQEEFQKFLKSGIGFLGLDHHVLEARM